MPFLYNRVYWDHLVLSIYDVIVSQKQSAFSLNKAMKHTPLGINQQKRKKKGPMETTGMGGRDRVGGHEYTPLYEKGIKKPKTSQWRLLANPQHVLQIKQMKVIISSGHRAPTMLKTRSNHS